MSSAFLARLSRERGHRVRIVNPDRGLSAPDHGCADSAGSTCEVENSALGRKHVEREIDLPPIDARPAAAAEPLLVVGFHDVGLTIERSLVHGSPFHRQPRPLARSYRAT